MTLLNGEDPYRSDEFVGVTAMPGGNPDKKVVTLNPNDFIAHIPGLAAIAAEGDDSE
jgi:hypothetical protein